MFLCTGQELELNSLFSALALVMVEYLVLGKDLGNIAFYLDLALIRKTTNEK